MNREASIRDNRDIAANTEGELTENGVQKEPIVKRKVKKPTYLKDFI